MPWIDAATRNYFAVDMLIRLPLLIGLMVGLNGLPNAAEGCDDAFQRFWQTVEHGVDDLDLQRRQVLEQMADDVIAKRDEQPLTFNFICTHNSRRSQFSQVFAAFAANKLGLPDVTCFSGGTEVTACNERIIESLRRAGFAVVPSGPTINPRYTVSASDGDFKITLYSKRFDDVFTRDDTASVDRSGDTPSFFAMMCCSDVDESCPHIPGALGRYPLHYLDPKTSDDTSAETFTYDQRRDQIAREMLYLMRAIKRLTNDNQ